jgi:DNA-binding NtrC family response regulator
MDEERCKAALELAAQRVYDSGLVKYEDAIEMFRMYYLWAALLAHGGNVAETAAELRVHRNLIHRWVRTSDLPQRKLQRPAGD